METSRKQLIDAARKLAKQLQVFADLLGGVDTEEEQGRFLCPSCKLMKPYPKKRGVCTTCFQRVWQQIRRGNLSEEEAVAAGLISGKKDTPGRKPKTETAFDEFLKERKANAGQSTPSSLDDRMEKLDREIEEKATEISQKRRRKRASKSEAEDRKGAGK